MATLYVIGTPIGNLEDLSPRAAETLRAVDVCYAEDTRRSRTLLTHAGADTPLRSLHEHNERSRIEEVMDRLAAGQSVALVSDAGTPTVSDPGQRLLEAVVGAGHRVSPIPGASAVLAALSVSGFPADRFVFVGFAPRRGEAREAWLGDIDRSTETVVAFEAPGRVADTLDDLAAHGLGERRVVVCRELTKLHEEIGTGTISELATVYRTRSVKGEVTFVIAGGPGARSAVDVAEVRAAARDLAAEGVSRRDIAERLSERFGVSRNEAYRLSLSLSEAEADD